MILSYNDAHILFSHPIHVFFFLFLVFSWVRRKYYLFIYSFFGIIYLGDLTLVKGHDESNRFCIPSLGSYMLRVAYIRTVSRNGF